MNRNALIAAGFLSSVWASIALGSFVFLCLQGYTDAFEFPFDQVLVAIPYVYAQRWHGMGTLAVWNHLAFGIIAMVLPIAALLVALVRRYWFRRPLTPTSDGAIRPAAAAITDNHGHSQWRSMDDARKLFPGPDPRHGGVVVGEAYRVDHDIVAKTRFRPRDRHTWGRGGTAPLLIDPCSEGSGHSIVFAGSGAYKTTTAVATALHWTGSSVILDPSTELGPMLDAALRAQGKDVVHIGIPGDHGTLPPVNGFNVLAWIDTSSVDAEVQTKTVVSWIYSSLEKSDTGGKEDPFFAPMGRDLVTTLLAHLSWSDLPAEDKTLATLATGMAIPEDEMLTVLAGIRTSSNSPMARRLAGSLMRIKAEETWSGIFLNGVHGVSWLFVSAYADMLSRGDFDPRSLLEGNTTVFLNIGLRTLEHTPAIARVLVGALLNTCYAADGKTDGRVLFLLDEAARLGRLGALETARDTGRKYGVSLHLLIQSMGQMAEIWGPDSTRAWIDAANWIGYAAIRAGGAGKDISEQLGSHGVLAYSQGDNSGTSRPAFSLFGNKSTGANVNTHEIRRSLLAVAETQQNLRDDEIIIVPASGFPIRCGRAIYFRRPEIVQAIGRNRFVAAE